MVCKGALFFFLSQAPFSQATRGFFGAYCCFNNAKWIFPSYLLHSKEGLLPDRTDRRHGKDKHSL